MKDYVAREVTMPADQHAQLSVLDNDIIRDIKACARARRKKPADQVHDVFLYLHLCDKVPHRKIRERFNAIYQLDRPKPCLALAEDRVFNFTESKKIRDPTHDLYRLCFQQWQEENDC
jgi:hypothetical protein